MKINKKVRSAIDVLGRIDPGMSWSDVEQRARSGTSSSSDELNSGSDPLLPTGRGARGPVLVGAFTVAVALLVWTLVLRLDGDASTQDVATEESAAGQNGTQPSSPPHSVASTFNTSQGEDGVAHAEGGIRAGPVVAWTGSTLLVWGGEFGTEPQLDGWSFDPKSGSTAEIPEGPASMPVGTSGVWTGDKLVVCCGFTLQTDADASAATAAYDPKTGAWQPLSPPPDELATGERYTASVWTGSQMLVVATDQSGPTTVGAYDPSTDTWSAIDGAPSAAGSQPTIAWSGSELVLWIHSEEGQPDQGWTYSPDDATWRPLPAAPSDLRTQGADIAWTSAGLAVWGQSTADPSTSVGALYNDSSTAWASLPALERAFIRPFQGTPRSQSLAYDAEADRLVLWPTAGIDDAGEGVVRNLYGLRAGAASWDVLASVDLGYNPTLLAVNGVVMVPDRSDPVVAE